MADEPACMRLSDICEQIADCPHSTPLWTSTGVIVLRNQNIRNGRLDLSAPSYTDEHHFEQRSRRARLRAGDLVLTREAPMGELCMIPQNLRCCLGQRMVLLRTDPNKCHARYLLYAIQSESVQREIKVNEGTGSTVSNLRIPLLEALPIPSPPLPDQRAIAAVLGALDDKIDLNRRMCATLEEMARALFKSWFVDFDPVRAKMEGRDPGLPKEIADLFPSRLVASELGEIPEGWKVGSAEDVSVLNPESWTTKSRPGVVRYLDLASAKWGRFDAALELAGEEIPSRAQRVLRSGDSIIGTVRPGNGSYGLISEDGLTGSTGFAVLRPSRTHCRTYVYCTTTSHANIDRLSRLADGGAYPAVRPEVVVDTHCVIPPTQLLIRLEETAGGLLVSVAQRERESRTLTALRDTLLPKLISGELRVPASLGSMQEVAS